MPLWLLITIQVAPSALLVLVGVLLGALRSGALQRELAATRANAYPPAMAFQRYARDGTVGRITLAVLATLAPFVAVVINLIIVFAAAASSATAYVPDLTPVGVVLGIAFIPCVLAPNAAYAIASATTDARAMRELRGLATRPADLVGLRLKMLLLLTAPTLIFIEVVVALFSTIFSLEARITIFVALVLAIAGFVVVWSNRLRLLYPTTPLAQTPWAPLATRANAWARLAGVPLRGVRMLRAGELGFADGNITGVFGRTIYLSDRFLQATEWRQQDALIAFLLGLDKRRRSLYLIRYGSSALVLVVYAVILFVPGSLSSVTFALFPVVFIVLIVSRILRISGSVYSMTRRYTLLSDADRLGAELTGDPIAVMAMLTTVTAITTQDPTTATVAGATLPPRLTLLTPNIGQRVATLDTLLRQPGPRAPWANQPVPSVAPLIIGPFTLTTPLQPGQATAPAPTPVPAARYPVVAPPPPAYIPFMPPMGPAPVGAPVAPYPTQATDSSAYPQPPAPPQPSAYPYPQPPAYPYPQPPAYPYPAAPVAPTPPAPPAAPTPPTTPG